MLNLLPVGWLVICYQSYYGRVISKFDDGIGGVDGTAARGEEGLEEGAEDTTLWCASVQDEMEILEFAFYSPLIRYVEVNFLYIYSYPVSHI